MTNREWLFKKMQNMSDEELMKVIDKGIDIDIMVHCNPHCDYSEDCENCTIKWLKAEHKEKITLSEAERIILENIDKDYKWIARDEDKRLFIFRGKPETNGVKWWHSSYKDMCVFGHLFQFIKWEDEQPYNIEELLKGE